eukprot:1177000-Prorocentrum_minimum.AAC.2
MAALASLLVPACGVTLLACLRFRVYFSRGCGRSLVRHQGTAGPMDTTMVQTQHTSTTRNTQIQHTNVTRKHNTQTQT